MYTDRFPKDTPVQQATVPDTEFFLPDDVHQEQADDVFMDRLDTLSPGDTVIITHDDADGLASGVYMKHWVEGAFNTDATIYPTGYSDACNLPRALELLCTRRDELEALPGRVVVTDLGASLFEESEQWIKELYHFGVELIWIDHHQWGADQLTTADSYGSIVVDDSACATKLITDLRDGEHDGIKKLALPADGTPEKYRELADVVNDHDIWIKEDPRSDKIATFAAFADHERFFSAVNLGVALFETHKARIERYEQESNELFEYCVENAVFETFHGVETGIAYGYGPSSDVGNELVESYGVELAVVLRPDGSVSFYADSSEEEFARCHEVAAQFNGGGHPTAAGGELPLETFNEYVHLWNQQANAYHGMLAGAIDTVGN